MYRNFHFFCHRGHRELRGKSDVFCKISVNSVFSVANLMKRKKGRLPDLAGVKIYITGATAGTPDKFFAVQNFWLMYFKECGASLSKENYGATLLNFDE